MSSYFEDVGDFHLKFDLPVSKEYAIASDRLPQLLDDKEMEFRTAFLFEEIRELLMAEGQVDLPKMADAIVDTIYVLLGTAHYMGLPFDQLWKAVHEANMKKRPWKKGDLIKPRNTQGFEVTKPLGWEPPDIAGIIRSFHEKNS